METANDMGAYRVLVSLPVFKTGVAPHNGAGWVRFPHAPANDFFNFNKLSRLAAGADAPD